MADRTFTLDWRLRTRKNETVVRAKLGALDTPLSFRKRAPGPVRIDGAELVPSAPASWRAVEAVAAERDLDRAELAFG